MSTKTPPASKGLLVRGLKLIGRLTSPETRTGRVFSKAERGLTKVSAKLSESPTWLRISGGLMRRGFNLRIRRQALQERALLALRLPAASEVEALRDQLRQLNNQVEALGSQIELVVDLLERQEQPERGESTLQEAPSREPAPRRHGT
jgi:TolA-binding protein